MAIGIKIDVEHKEKKLGNDYKTRTKLFDGEEQDIILYGTNVQGLKRRQELKQQLKYINHRMLF